MKMKRTGQSILVIFLALTFGFANLKLTHLKGKR